MTVQGLQIFNPKATVYNLVPTVNHNLSQTANLVLPFAPDHSVSGSFHTPTMNAIDSILSTLGTKNDGLGPNWSPIERIAHHFHMQDLWERVHLTYQSELLPNMPDSLPAVCACLTATSSNGIADKVQWVAEHYKSGTPITLLNRPIPKLADASSWAVWKVAFPFIPSILSVDPAPITSRRILLAPRITHCAGSSASLLRQAAAVQLGCVHALRDQGLLEAVRAPGPRYIKLWRSLVAEEEIWRDRV
jgi:hypothetical protein